MTSISKRAGFTLVELLVVVAMIAAVMGAMTVSSNGAAERARIEKARAEVKTISQAILSYENYVKDGLPILGGPGMGVEVSRENLGFLWGEMAVDKNGNQLPALMQAALSAGGKIVDPWGMPYTVVIAPGTVGYQKVNTLRTGFSLPNIHRLSEEERK